MIEARVNRRQCLQIGLAVTALGAYRGYGIAAETGKLSFGFSLYGMRSLKLDEALRECAAIGYQAVELAVMPDWPADPRTLGAQDRKQLAARLKELNLQLPALMENIPLAGGPSPAEQLRRLQAAAELGRELIPNRPPLIETILGGRPGQWDMLRGSFAEALKRWAELAERLETVICVKPHRGNAMDRPEHAAALVQEVGSRWIQLAYDYSHFQHRDLGMAETIQAMQPHIRFVHVKDTVLEDGRTRFVLPGDGGIDYAQLLPALVASGYRGCVCVEVSGMVQSQPGYDPIAAARRSYENLTPALRAL